MSRPWHSQVRLPWEDGDFDREELRDRIAALRSQQAEEQKEQDRRDMESDRQRFYEESLSGKCEFYSEKLDYESGAGDGVGEFYDPLCEPTGELELDHKIGHYQCAKDKGWEIA